MKSGSLFLTLVLLVALAIPLFAGHALGNTVGESSAMSINWKEEVALKDVPAPYGEMIGIPPKPIPVMWLPVYTNDKLSQHDIAEIYIPRFMQKYGGVRRIKSGRH